MNPFLELLSHWLWGSVFGFVVAYGSLAVHCHLGDLAKYLPKAKK